MSHQGQPLRIRFQDLETVCSIDLGAVFGHIAHEYSRIMFSTAPEDKLTSPVPLQQESFLPPQQRVETKTPALIQKPRRWNVMPSDRGLLNEVFMQVQQDAEYFEQYGVHVLTLDDPLRAEHAAICLATNHVLKGRNVSVF